MVLIQSEQFFHESTPVVLYVDSLNFPKKFFPKGARGGFI